jgi:hypothetical protein
MLRKKLAIIGAGKHQTRARKAIQLTFLIRHLHSALLKSLKFSSRNKSANFIVGLELAILANYTH